VRREREGEQLQAFKLKKTPKHRTKERNLKLAKSVQKGN
jgi:hypothetical protein